jgi:hypothetical protein
MDKMLACSAAILRGSDPFHGMEQKSSRPAGRIYNKLTFLGIQHLHTHIYDIARCEELTVLLGNARHQVFKRIIHYTHVCAQQTDAFERTNDHLQMLWS